MGETLAAILGLVLLGGFIAAIVAYKPVNYKLIREKGYDADEGLPHILAMATVILPAVLGFAAVQNGVILGLLALVPFVLAVVLRIPKIGVGSALLVTFLQAVGAIWMIIKAVWKFAESVMGRTQAASDKTIALKNAQEAKKAELKRAYEAKVADIERHSDTVDDVLGDTDAAIAAARDDYERDVTKSDHEYKG